MLNSGNHVAQPDGRELPENEPLALNDLVVTAEQSVSALHDPVRERPEEESESESELPITKHLPEIIDLVDSHDVTIVCVPTGGGKTTRLTQALAHRGYRVFCTQPTRIAVTSMQPYVESQFGGTNGELVGYKHG